MLIKADVLVLKSTSNHSNVERGIFVTYPSSLVQRFPCKPAASEVLSDTTDGKEASRKYFV